MDPFDLHSLTAHRTLLEGLDPEGSPALALLNGSDGVPSSVAVLPGSFNPPTAAHQLLAERALAEGFERVVLTLSRRTAGKEPGGMIPEDRLMAMRSICGPGMTVGVCSHGLYPDQAAAAAAAFPGADVAFLVGSDKVLQILDPAWYEDRDTELDRFFGAARLVCAPRGDHADALRATLNDPANAPWASRVSLLRLHPAVVDLSSTHVRGLLHAGADPAGLVPAAVAAFLGVVRAYAPPVAIDTGEVDAYELRARLFDLIARLDGGTGDAFDLRELIETATARSHDGEHLRAALHSDERSAAAVLRALAR